MIRTPRLLPECFGDTTLMNLLGYDPVSHQRDFGIGQVLQTMQKYFQNQLAVGVVDSDKTITAKAFQEFEMVKTEPHLHLKKHPQRRHYLIVLEPAIEKFLFTAASQANVDPAKFGFADLGYFTKICKRHDVANNQQFKQFINSIKQKQEPSCLKTLQSWLLELLGEEF